MAIRLSLCGETQAIAPAGEAYDVDAIVYATGLKATEYLFPMSITGRAGKTVEELWSQTGALGYVGAMLPGCPNLWTLYGPNGNGGLLVPAFQEMETRYALKCIERLILDGKNSIDVKVEPYRPETGQLCIDRNLIVIPVLSGGREKGPSFSYSPS